jgi:hypothetical protein
MLAPRTGSPCSPDWACYSSGPCAATETLRFVFVPDPCFDGCCRVGGGEQSIIFCLNAFGQQRGIRHHTPTADECDIDATAARTSRHAS